MVLSSCQPDTQLGVLLVAGNVVMLRPVPSMQRYYSISSSPNLHPGEVHLTVAVVEYHVKPIPGHNDAVQALSTSWEEKGGTKHFGVCSNWLNKIEIGASVPCFFRKYVVTNEV